MKLKIEETTTHEVEVTLPCYRKYGSNVYFKVLDEKTTLKVAIRTDDVEIMMSPYYMPIAFHKTDSIEITPEEFSKMFILAKNLLNEL